MDEKTLNRKIKIEYIKETKVKKIIRLNCIIATMFGIFYLIRKFGEYNFFEFIQVIVVSLMMLNTYVFLWWYLKGSFLMITRSNIEEKKFNEFKEKYMQENLSNKIK